MVLMAVLVGGAVLLGETWRRRQPQPDSARSLNPEAIDMTTDNEALVTRLWNQIWIAGEFDDLDQLLADPYVRHTRDGTLSMSPAEYAKHVKAATRTIRGTEVTIVDIASTGDMVFARTPSRRASTSTPATH